MRKLPEFRLVAEPVSPEAEAARGFRWAGGDVGHRHQLGGEPALLHAAEVLVCPSCGGEMTFYGQLDSIGDEIALADVGMVFIYVCFDCFESTSFIQSA